MELYELHLLELLKARIGEKEAIDVVRHLENRVYKHFIDPKYLVASKEDIAMIKADIHNVKITLLKWMLVLFITMILAVLGSYI